MAVTKEINVIVDETFVCQRFEQLLTMKRHQRVQEERLLQTLGKPEHRKWMHERVQDQYNHEKLIMEIVKHYLGRIIEIGRIQGEVWVDHSMAYALEKRLEGVTANIQMINEIGYQLDAFETYRVVMSMLGDEYVYQARLVKILSER